MRAGSASLQRRVVATTTAAAHFRGSAEFQLDLNPSMSAWS
jgi:hypothetical protein